MSYALFEITAIYLPPVIYYVYHLVKWNMSRTSYTLLFKRLVI